MDRANEAAVLSFILHSISKVVSMAEAVCFYCGRKASDAGILTKSQSGMICEECTRIALNLAQDRREGTVDANGRLEIDHYAADAGLAQRIGQATLVQYPFVPLDVRDDHVVLAVAGWEGLEDLKQIVLDALERVTTAGRQRDVVDFVLARPQAIMDKIASIFTIEPAPER